MKRYIISVLALALAVLLTACGGEANSSDNAASSNEQLTVPSESVSISSVQTQSETSSETISEIPEETQMQLNIEVNGHLLTAELADSSSATALLELLAKGSITIEMHDYGNMEKVGALPQSLPRNDKQTTVGAGDLILYQGDQFSIYYDTNSWSFTRLGKITNVSESELRDILGSGNVTVNLSIPE